MVKKVIKEDKLIHSINGIDYLLVSRLVTTRTQKKLSDAISKHNCIEQGIQEIYAGGLWSSPYAVVLLLVPFSKIEAFNKET